MIELTQHRDEIDAAALEALWTLVQLCFDPEPGLDFAKSVREKRRPAALIAWQDGEPVGFKLGYERSADEFYSWLGGVHPDSRRVGIAKRLMEHQHAWCRQVGYRRVTTEALNTNRGMVLLNVESGFTIVGTRHDHRGLKLLFERELERDALASPS